MYVCMYVCIYILCIIVCLTVFIYIVYCIGIYRSPKSVFIQVIPKANKLFDSSFKVINN